MFSHGLFWFIMGMLSILVVVCAKTWADKSDVNMTWWKWIIAALWYIGFLFSIAVPATFMGEGEIHAGLTMIVFSVVPSIIIGFIVWRVITSVGKG
jgi:hypothetical protein